MEVVASRSQGRTSAAQCGLFTHKSVPVIFEPPCKIPGHAIFKLSQQLDLGVTVQYFDVSNQQDATNFSFINLFNSSLHVSGDKFAHSQELFLTVYTSIL